MRNLCVWVLILLINVTYGDPSGMLGVPPAAPPPLPSGVPAQPTPPPLPSGVPAQPPSAPTPNNASNVAAAAGPAGQVDTDTNSDGFLAGKGKGINFMNFKNYSSLAATSTNGSSTLHEKSSSVQELDKDGKKTGAERMVMSKTGFASDKDGTIDQFDGLKVQRINNGTAITEDKEKLAEDTRTQVETNSTMGEYLETVSNGTDAAKQPAKLEAVPSNATKPANVDEVSKNADPAKPPNVDAISKTADPAKAPNVDTVSKTADPAKAPNVDTVSKTADPAKAPNVDTVSKTADPAKASSLDTVSKTADPAKAPNVDAVSKNAESAKSGNVDVTKTADPAQPPPPSTLSTATNNTESVNPPAP